MTLPSSGPLTLSQINAEFGLGTNLGAYRGATWYTDSGSSGTFPTTNLGINQFYAKRSTAPYLYGSMSAYGYYYQGSFYFSYTIAYGQPSAYFEIWLSSTTSGNPISTSPLFTGYLNSSGSYSSPIYPIQSTDGYWFPASQTNCFTYYQDGIKLNTSCTSS